MARRIEFPDSFLWGAATSSYQIEGAVTEDGRGPSIWDTFCNMPGKVKRGDTGSKACDHYNRYKEDVQLMKEIGLDAYRFSIAWPRILPHGTGTTNRAGLDFYDRLVDELLAYDIQPWVTLYHWDLPQALQDSGGWASRDIVDAFVDYADIVTRRLTDRVKHWMTLNEPWVFTFLGNGEGRHAPGLTDWRTYLATAHHALLAHAGAAQVVRANGDRLTQVGIAPNTPHIQPASDEPGDVAAAQRYADFEIHWFLDPIYKGAYPAELANHYGDLMPEVQPGDMEAIAAAPRDFLAINYYFREIITHDPEGGVLQASQVAPPVPDDELTVMGWESHAESLYAVLAYLNERYAPGAIYITENGAAYPDEVQPDGIHDTSRVTFYREHLTQAGRAVTDGIPLRGYFAWSLMDNFEWAEGYEPRFGLIHVDYATQRRRLKNSARWYSETIKQNGFLLPDSAT